MKILLSGGAGYIGTHIAVELLENGYEVVIADNLCNSRKEAVLRVEEITKKKVIFYELDIRNQKSLEKVFTEHKFAACIHCAGLKAVGESVMKPLEYYDNNVGGSLSLLQTMQKFDCHNIIFSSSATVYGTPDRLPLTEDSPKKECSNPYGWSKSMIEQILIDLQYSDKKWNVMLLRYFNPIGAHSSGKIGENPQGIPNNLMPYITQVASKKREFLNIYGNDYDTPDGTGVRDYIHISDLAKGHLKALEHLDGCGIKIYNLGTGKGYSVLEVVHAFEKANGIKIPYQFAPRRQGDLAMYYASAQKAEKELGWKAELSLEDMCRDAWRWQKNNPNGYD